MTANNLNINHELEEIDQQLDSINQQIEYLQYERDNLLKRREECCKKQNATIEKSSLHGNEIKQIQNNWKSEDFQWSKNVKDVLKTTFKLNSFRDLQLETINVTLSKKDCIVIMPTGGGKSLCFQLPALIDNGVTIVVSPLVSLMEDQLWSLKLLNIYAETINASSTKEHVKKIHDAMLDKSSDLKLLYVTPEKLAKSKIFMNKLQKMYEIGRFSRLVIDEVHCASTYGHDFRPDYKFLGIMKNQFPNNVPILGLTATATNDVLNDVKKILRIPNCVLFKSSFNRPNIYYEVKEKPSNNEECMNSIANLIKAEFPNESGIVYCFSQSETEKIASDLCSRGIRAGCYHAQMDSSQRTKVHEKWIKKQVHVICATIAFGMGIDKADCRFVIHHSLSKSLENFYQESGRAGRDGLQASSYLFFRYADVFRQSTLVFTEQTGLINLHSIIEYCINFTKCKRDLIAKHFDDELWSSTGECNKMCDFCRNLETKTYEKVNCIEEAKLVFEILDKTVSKDKDKRLTANKLAELLYGELNSKSNKDKYEKLSQLESERLILEMLMKQYLREDFHFTPYNTICYLVRGERSRMLYVANKFEINLMKNSKSSKANNEPQMRKKGNSNSNSNKLDIQVSKEITIDDEDDIIEEEENIICLDFDENESDSDFKPKNKKIKN